MQKTFNYIDKMYRAHLVPGEEPFVEVVKTEEKGTDVNIATPVLTDAQGSFHKPPSW
jgi:hypothetical protein